MNLFKTKNISVGKIISTLGFMLLLTTSLNSLKAQPGIQLNYIYLKAPVWDKIIQTYNTSRPWNEDQLIPLTHAFGAHISYNWPVLPSRMSSREIHLLPELGYHNASSSATNKNHLYAVGFHQFNIGVTIRAHPKTFFKPVQNAGPLGTRWYLAAGGGLAAFLPFVKNNRQLLQDRDQEPYRELSYSAYWQINTGYHLLIIGNFAITTEIGMVWMPDVELTDFAEAVNGHNISGMINTQDNVLLFRGGIRITYLKKKSNWWDTPRTGDKT